MEGPISNTNMSLEALGVLDEYPPIFMSNTCLENKEILELKS